MTHGSTYIQLSGTGEFSKTALVLAGGGLTGAVYEIGALRAIDELLVNRSVNDFDVIVGTSAGALVGSLLAKGLTPGELMQMVDGTHPRQIGIQPEHIFSLNSREFLRRSLRLPATAKRAILHYLRHQSDINLFDLLWSLVEIMPSGLYDNRTLEEYLQRELRALGLDDDFQTVGNELYIIATDLDTGERVVFGRDELADAPLSKAVAASSAVPLLYRPVRFRDREFVDGGLRGTASLDLAIEAGAKLIVCINPLVPLDNSDKDQPALGPEARFISEKGFQAVGAQVLRIIMQSGLEYHIKQLRRRHPDVDIILIQPRRDDARMFFYNIMRYSARVTIARHGFESVTIDLADQYPQLKATLSRHGFEITRRFVIEELEAIRASGYDIEVIRKMLERSERRKRSFAEGRVSDPITGLKLTLAQLERVVAEINR
ncbi:MAG: patatin family protein [Chloroflexi bacterium]|nr:patatin family protein [Chloroflexota bacterium]